MRTLCGTAELPGDCIVQLQTMRLPAVLRAGRPRGRVRPRATGIVRHFCPPKHQAFGFEIQKREPQSLTPSYH